MGSLLSRTAAQNIALPSRRGGAKFLGWRHLLNRSGDTAGERWGESAREIGIRPASPRSHPDSAERSFECPLHHGRHDLEMCDGGSVHQMRRIGDTQCAVCVGGHTVPTGTR